MALYRFAKRIFRRQLRSLWAPSCRLLTSKGEVSVLLPRPAEVGSFYLFALTKGGSSLLNSMMHSVLRYLDFPQLALPEIAWEAGLPTDEILNPEQFIHRFGYCYRGFRNFPPYLKQFDISTNKKVLLVRDPRDILVSCYYSVRYSHRIPSYGNVRSMMLEARRHSSELSIDEYCLTNLNSVRQELDSYDRSCFGELRVFRYEDIVYKKAEWLAEMLDYLDFPVSSRVINKICRVHDVFPDTERVNEHVRQVRPGNYKTRLRHHTIETMNKQLCDLLVRYGYR
jgi:hypothetical protein